MLRDWLNRHRLTQKDLADRVGTTQAAISKLVQGKSRPGLALAKRIEAATQFASPDDRKPVQGLPTIVWLTFSEFKAIRALQRTGQTIRGRETQDAAVLAQEKTARLAQETLRGQEERKSELLNRLARSPSGDGDGEIRKELEKVDDLIEVLTRLIEESLPLP